MAGLYGKKHSKVDLPGAESGFLIGGLLCLGTRPIQAEKSRQLPPTMNDAIGYGVTYWSGAEPIDEL
jgi:hypothetical protein